MASIGLQQKCEGNFEDRPKETVSQQIIQTLEPNSFGLDGRPSDLETIVSFDSPKSERVLKIYTDQETSIVNSEVSNHRISNPTKCLKSSNDQTQKEIVNEFNHPVEVVTNIRSINGGLQRGRGPYRI